MGFWGAQLNGILRNILVMLVLLLLSLMFMLGLLLLLLRSPTMSEDVFECARGRAAPKVYTCARTEGGPLTPDNEQAGV